MIPAEAEEPVFPEDEGGPARRLDFYGLSIPPLVRELRRQLAAHFHTRGMAPAWYVPRQLNPAPYHHFRDARHADELPGLIADAGPRYFARRDFLDRWRGTFAPLPPLPLRPEFGEAGLADPEGLVHVHACACWLILADLEMLGTRPLPRHWSDLLHPRYERDIVLNGDEHGPNPLILANLARDCTPAALEALGRNTVAIQGGAEMARAAGSRSPRRAALYVLPRFWAENNIHRDTTRIVWPEEGAYATPLLLLGKRDAGPSAAAVFDFLHGPQWNGQLENIHCIPADGRRATRPVPGRLRWLGWQAARDPALDDTIRAASAHFHRGYSR
ncbi:ABC transporter substrate-binding protein [Pseudothauera rhizosphaerae]|uniref:ABC transporter substrate-binding protein n=1 Tax=Pseudothauera rhizosphaerae TaxID=2565932 RepID=A0A4S4A8Q2_9RHOO|nr:ABC transporter substrate-binding protein [Pseudothauera rhizosphaerae]THF55140.1 ABC transporter substrate-binding protein [Pseudothauera rhizosphaerae]